MTATAIRHTPGARERITGLLATVSILGLVVGLPVLLVAASNALWPRDLSWTNAPTVLASPDGTGLIITVTLALWVLWAWLSVTVLIQVTALVSGIRLPRLPGLPHGLAGRLVAAAALLFASVPTAHALPPDVDVAAVAPLDPQRTTDRPVTADGVDRSRTSEAFEAATNPATTPVTRPYTVKRNDTLWALARDHLGDGGRWREIFDLNQKVLGTEPDFLPTGVVLRLPTEDNLDLAPVKARTAPTAQSKPITHVVQPGDTLWQIAGEHLDDPHRYPEIVHASAATTQPGGHRLVDSDLIQPGWTLTIPPATTTKPASHQEPPATPEQATSQPDEPTHQSSEHPVTPPTEQQSRAPSASAPSAEPTSRPGAITPWTSPTLPTGTHTSGSATDRDPGADSRRQLSDDIVESDASSYLVPGLTGAGMILAAGLYLALQRREALRRRYRRPGRAVRTGLDSPVPVEHTLRVSGAPALPDVNRLDQLLWALAGVTEESTEPRPPLVAVELTRTEAVVHFAEQVDLPEPWTGSAERWSAELAAADHLDENLTGFRPYPMLATIGQDDDGHTWLVDLERARRLVVTGDPVQGTDFGRALTAELAVNPWSEHVTPHTIGFDHIPHHLGIDSRIAAHSPTEAATDRPVHDDTAEPVDLSGTEGENWIHELATQVRQHYDAPGDDREWFHPVIATGPGVTYPGLDELAATLQAHPGRPGAVVISVGAQPSPGDVVVHITDGRVRVTVSGIELELAAVGLSETELDVAAALVDLHAEDALSDVPVPVPVDQAGRPALSDATGAPRTDTTRQRPEDADQPAGPSSLLPASVTYYETTGITTAEELDRIAPITPTQTADDLLAEDPELDADVAEWFTPEVARPRLRLLGPVSLRSSQISEDAIRHKARLIEYAAYLWLHPHGVSSDALSDDMHVPVDRVRKDILDLRKWLGTSPRTGELHIPTARKGQPFEQTGSKGYQIHDILVDTDLFVRLRRRAHARGADGIADLHTALRLVGGKPFDLLRRDGWAWLTGGERPDLMIEHAIIDAAHTVFLRSMADGDHDQARSVCTTALDAVPQDEIIRMDLVQLDWAQGHVGSAEQRLRDEVFDRTDHGLADIDLSGRTRKVLEGKQDDWDHRRQQRSARNDPREDSNL